MTKIETFMNVLCRDFDFSHGDSETKRARIELLMEVAELELVEKARPGLHSEYDNYVRARAEGNADAPYDQRTCERYPWAAAARIRHLEGIVAAMRGDVQQQLPAPK